MSVDRCTDCPIAGRCVVDWTNHRAYCRWAKRGGKWLKEVQRLSASGPGEVAETLAPPSADTQRFGCCGGGLPPGIYDR
jgi:hypothetical protein